ncbi:hypothetical protein INT43_008224 [Umbelopsis isabellina]|uniref:Uncharacterized protein n=1 Tax=Mortierella isabellina TaxID=91625 RepID=A0A8H7PDU2_MORIS|nr:hypothetical protein INT43_008224 [Umbelopsis isabellina]
MSITVLPSNQNNSRKLTNAFAKLNIRRSSQVEQNSKSISPTTPPPARTAVVTSDPCSIRPERRVSFTEEPPKVHYFDRQDHEEDWFIYDAKLDDERNCPWKYYCREEKKGFKGTLKSMFSGQNKKCINENDEEDWEEYQPTNLWRQDTAAIFMF